MIETNFYQCMAETYRGLTGITPDEASDTAIRFHALAAELEKMEERVKEAEKQAFPQTAAADALDLHAADRGITRKPAAFAAGELVFSRLDASGIETIPKGTVCAAKDGTEYVTEQAAVFGENEKQVAANARAVCAGAGGNAASGAIVRVRQITGIKVLNPKPFTGGYDAESDESLRQRLLDAFSAPNTGINPAFYQQAAQACSGVQSASCLAGEQPGEVIIYVTGEEAKPVSNAVLKSVQETLSAMREPFASVLAQNAEILSTDFSLMVENIAGTKSAEVCSHLAQAIRSYTNTLAVGEKLTLAALMRLIVNSGLAENWRLLSPQQDILPNPSQAVRAGSITVKGWEA